MFCSLQLELNPTIVYHSMFYLLLSHRSCKTICHNPSAARLCCIWNDSSIRCLHFIDHNIALCWIPGNMLQHLRTIPPIFKPQIGRSHGTAHDWFLKLLGFWTRYDLEKMMSHQWMEWGTPSPVPTPNTKFHIVGYISVYIYILLVIMSLYIDIYPIIPP